MMVVNFVVVVVVQWLVVVVVVVMVGVLVLVVDLREVMMTSPPERQNPNVLGVFLSYFFN